MAFEYFNRTMALLPLKKFKQKQRITFTQTFELEVQQLTFGGFLRSKSKWILQQ